MAAFMSSQSVIISPSRPINTPAPNCVRDRFDARPFYLKPMIIASKEARLSAAIDEQQLQIESLMREVARLTQDTNALTAINHSLVASNRALTVANNRLSVTNEALEAAAASTTPVETIKEKRSVHFAAPLTPPSSPILPPGLPLPRLTTPPTSPVARPRATHKPKVIRVSAKGHRLMLPKSKAQPSPPMCAAPQTATQLATPPPSILAPRSQHKFKASISRAHPMRR